MTKRLLLIPVLTILFLVASNPHAEAASANRSQCAVISAEMRRQGASAAVASQFARIAWRESGCVAQFVIDRDDTSFSRFGLNFKGRMPAYWMRVCGVSNFHATANLATDVRCALAAFHRAGWRPWR
jgi:hypothetical protein